MNTSLRATLADKSTVFILIALFASLIFFKHFSTPYHYVDEVEWLKISEIHPSATVESKQYNSFLGYQQKYLSHGRFKPVAVAIHYVFGNWIGDRVLPARIYLLCIFILSWFFTARIVMYYFKPLISIVLSAFILWGWHNEIWFRIGPSESLGYLFLVLGVLHSLHFFQKQKWQPLILALSFYALAFLCKESYLALWPPLILFMPFLTAKEKGVFLYIPKYKTWHVAMTLLGALFAVMFIWFLMHHTAYRSSQQNSFWSLALHNASFLLGPKWHLLACVLFILPIGYKKKLFALLFYICVQLPQFIVLKDNIIPGPCRYVFPAHLAGSVLVIIVVHQINHLYSNRRITIFSYSVAMALGLYLGKNFFNEILWFSKTTKNYHKMVGYLKRHRKETICYFNERGKGNELATATHLLLKKQNPNANFKLDIIQPIHEHLTPNEKYLMNVYKDSIMGDELTYLQSNTCEILVPSAMASHLNIDTTLWTKQLDKKSFSTQIFQITSTPPFLQWHTQEYWIFLNH